jgi:glycosyltransferase involved in cell wall biosynthesis
MTLVVSSTAATRADLPDMPRLVVPLRRASDEAAATEDWRGPVDLWRMARALSRFDVIIFPTHYSYVPVSPRALVGIVIHDAIRETIPEVADDSRGARIRWQAKSWLACRQAAVIATMSEAAARTIREHLPVGNKPLIVLGGGVDPVFSTEVTPEDARLVEAWAPPGRRFVLFVGGLSPHKRVPQLVHAFGQVAADPACADMLLVLVGAKEGSVSELASVEHAIDALGPVASRVVRSGFLSDHVLAALYRRAACVVQPSLAEGFGLPALEAMASGTPLIASRIPALEEVCGDAAEYFDDTEQLPGVILRMLQDPARRDALARAGLSRAGAFAWDASARRLLAALGTLA